MTYTLPTTLQVGGKDYPIRTSWIAALDIVAALSDPDWAPAQKAEILLTILYKQPIPAQYTEEAIKQAYWYLDGGQNYKSKKKSPVLMDWEKDWFLITAAINRVVNHDVRSDHTMHWWTFLAAYTEIDTDCRFAGIVNIRKKEATGEKLEPYEKRFKAENADVIALPQRYTQADDDTLSKFGIKRRENH